MRWCFVIFLFFAACTAGAQPAPEPAQSDAQRPQLDAATVDAVSNLRNTILSEQITPDLTTGAFLDKVNGRSDLNQTLQSARQIGGPRWLGADAVQVRLEISGSRLADALVMLAQSHPDESPLPAEALRRRLEPWSRRTFSATGSSVRAEQLNLLQPAELHGPWAAISSERRQAALAAAHDAAVENAIENVRSIARSSGSAVEQILSHPAAVEALRDWLARRPVTDVRLHDDLHVEVALAAEPDELVRTLRAAVPDAADEATWDRLSHALDADLQTPRGQASANGEQAVATSASVELPKLPPEWVEDQILATGTAPLGESKLKAARAAEANALRTLEEQLRALPLSPGLSIGQAAERDPRMAEAIGSALTRARTYKVDYGLDGEVQVNVQLNLRDAWNTLRATITRPPAPDDR